jgi:2-C-methyl-D-erythritol 4-phosphate cytidylyltransferase
MSAPHDPTPVWIAVPAAGSGARMGMAIPKQYLPLAGKPLAEHTLSALLAVPGLRQLVVALAPGDAHWPALSPALRGRVCGVEGGADRASSVLNALRAFDPLPAASDWVLVHDMARPCVRPHDILALVTTLADDEVGGLLAMPVVDTLKRADRDGRVEATVVRESLWRAQTPQMFRYGLLCRALQEARDAGVSVTDEAMAIERMGLRPRLVPCGAHNIKVTTAEDLALAAYYLGLAQENGA